MSDITRVLCTDVEVEHFVDGILNISDIHQKRMAINNIAAAERNIILHTLNILHGHVWTTAILSGEMIINEKNSEDKSSKNYIH